MDTVQEGLERFAEDVPYEELAAAFLEFDRPPGTDPVLLVAEAAASTTGQSYRGGIEPTVERFREAFRDSGRITSLEDLATLDADDEELVEAFGAERKRRVLVDIAAVLVERPEDDGFEALGSWAAEADVYRYEKDPIGQIGGIGPSTFQYLRQVAGIDTVKPDPPTVALVEAVDAELESSLPVETLDRSPLDASTPLRVVASVEWLSLVTSYTMLNIDRIAWYEFGTERDENPVEEVG